MEKSFLENPERPPIAGRDIIEILGVAPGREVSRLLEQANLLFHEAVAKKVDKLRGIQQARTTAS